ncbi:hypothetical protein A2379_02075 [Candidatus Amesbacteria bacterium RIFOXYB1_FULL_47_13]|nr:MAG: hypothetical protein A2379_02075 [Candidatus Amesbacteria bacterium RIFOXYB1_FULL_47_13]
MLTAVVLAGNEAKNLPECLKSLSFCDGILLVDDESSDNSVSIAKKHGAQTVTRPLDGDFAAQRNFALSNVASGWVLFVDPDEIVTADLAAEILQAVKRIEFKGYFIRRLDTLWGQSLHHGDQGSIRFLRLGRKGAGEWQGKVHERWVISGQTSGLKNPLMHHPHPTVSDFVNSQNLYSTLRARELFETGVRSNIFQIVFYPIAKFVSLYLFKKGFLDGIPGFISASMMSFYSFLVRGKLYLLGKGITENSS